MFCPKCGNKLDSKEEFCSQCGTKIGEEKKDSSVNNITNNSDSKKKMPTYLVVIISVVVFIIIVGIIGSISSTDSYDKNDVTNYDGKTTTTTVSKKKVLGFGDTFIFDDLEITIGSDIIFDTIKNQFSDNNGSTVVGVPITVKNLKEETHSLNMFYYDVFGSSGTEVDTVNSYFKDTLDFAGELRYNATYTKYTYFLYDGDGTYSIEFNNYSEKVLVEFQVNK